jgi:hypothetical protein
MTRHLPIRVAVMVIVMVLAFGVPFVSAAQPPGPQARGGQGGKPQLQAAPAKPAPPAPAKPGSQPPAAKPAAAAPSTEASKGAKPTSATPPNTAAQDGYSYRAEGRRDPFVTLLNRGTDQRGRRAEGVAGMLSADVVLRGTFQNRGTFLAIVQGPDGKRQFIVHPNDRFADGVVKAITADSMLILQEVNDPLSLTKQREIRKTLRSVEEVK